MSGAVCQEPSAAIARGITSPPAVVAVQVAARQVTAVATPSSAVSRRAIASVRLRPSAQPPRAPIARAASARTNMRSDTTAGGRSVTAA
jgi:hypothetical protein